MGNGNTATKLPSQVQKIGDGAEELATETGIKPGSKPVETASSKLVPVKTEPAKVDPDDYKTRYSNYKKATDATITELRQTLAAVQATLSDVQRQNQDLLAKVNTSAAENTTTAVPANTETSAVTKDDPAYKEYLARLPQSVKNEYAEDYLFDQFIILSSATTKTQGYSEEMTSLENKVETLVQDRELTLAEQYESDMDKAFPDDEWITLSSSPEWSKFCLQRVSAVDSRAYGDIAKDGHESKNATTTIWVLNEFKNHLSTLEEDTGQNINPLMNQITPEATSGGDPITEINAQTETFTVSQVNQFYVDVATGNNSKYSAEEAASIEKSIIAADQAGKIIQG